MRLNPKMRERVRSGQTPRTTELDRQPSNNTQPNRRLCPGRVGFWFKPPRMRRRRLVS